jgi:hypothetical protein
MASDGRLIRRKTSCARTLLVAERPREKRHIYSSLGLDPRSAATGIAGTAGRPGWASAALLPCNDCIDLPVSAARDGCVELSGHASGSGFSGRNASAQKSQCAEKNAPISTVAIVQISTSRRNRSNEPLQLVLGARIDGCGWPTGLPECCVGHGLCGHLTLFSGIEPCRDGSQHRDGSECRTSPLHDVLRIRVRRLLLKSSLDRGS